MNIPPRWQLAHMAPQQLQLSISVVVQRLSSELSGQSVRELRRCSEYHLHRNFRKQIRQYQLL